MQEDLFSSQQHPVETLRLDPRGIDILYLYRQFYTSHQAQQLMAQLTDELLWRQDSIRIAGRTLPIPRLQAWYGDADARYSYSGIELDPLPFNSTLISIKQDMEVLAKCTFNSLLANLYRNGDDSVGWHSDDEKELGKNPIIASVSLGATRRFSLKPKHDRRLKPIHLELSAGDVLIMAGETQHHWQHQVPKTKKSPGPRINLTFRKIHVK